MSKRCYTYKKMSLFFRSLFTFYTKIVCIFQIYLFQAEEVKIVVIIIHLYAHMEPYLEYEAKVLGGLVVSQFDI